MKPKWKIPSATHSRTTSNLLLLFFILLFSSVFILQYSPPVSQNQPISISIHTNEAPRIWTLNPAPIRNPCRNRYIYVHNLPSKFNDDLIKNCEPLTRPSDKSTMCDSILNTGFGPRIQDFNGSFSSQSWYATNQFLLEVIFHKRMMLYDCLTNDSFSASAIFVPYYAGLDLRRWLWGFNTSVRDSGGIELIEWLKAKPEWEKMQGRDHFLVAGRISKDFQRSSGRNSDWGSNFRVLPGSENISMLTIESGPYTNDFAVPYPTNFHPVKISDVKNWQNKIRLQKRSHLFSFAGAARKRRKGSIRETIINHCRDSSSRCKLLDCAAAGQNCDDPVNLMNMFRSSVFCLQPPGDSFTRRSTFDSILEGCIPVFFHAGSAYTQYKWHLPENGRKYSVFISPRDLRLGKVMINESLIEKSEKEVLALREEIIRLIPKVIYADPRSNSKGFEDAFDLAVNGVLENIGTKTKNRFSMFNL